MSVNQTIGFVKHQARTTDAFLGGKLSILQPEKGFRAGLDSVLLGASAAPGSKRLLDLGAGAGVAAFSAMAHNRDLEATLLELSPEMAALARANAEANGLGPRTKVIELDATARGAVRRAGGLPSDHFTTVLANPPFFTSGGGTPASEGSRAKARHMAQEELDLWVRTAVSCAAAGGEIVFIHVAEALPRLLSALAARIGGIAVLPLASRPGAPAVRVLVRGVRDSRAPLRLLAPLVLHGEDGNGFRPEVEAVLRGRMRLDWHSRA